MNHPENLNAPFLGRSYIGKDTTGKGPPRPPKPSQPFSFKRILCAFLGHRKCLACLEESMHHCTRCGRIE